MKSIKKIFGQWFELQVPKNLIVHVLSSGFNASKLELRKKKKATQQRSLPVTNDILRDQVRINHQKFYADNFLNKIWFVRSHVHTKECRNRSCICKLNLNCLLSSKHFNSDKVFSAIVSFLNESVHGINNIHIGREKT